MKNYTLKLLLFVSTLLLLLSNPLHIFADCQIANWDPNSRNLQVCVGRFDSPAQLRSTSANFHCLDNSNPGPGFCTGIENNNYSLSSTPDSQISQDSSGKYYTCITGQGLSRGIGRIEVVFSGGQSCTTTSLDTIPSDWNSLTEGTIFSGEPGRTGGSGGESQCISGGDVGVNTAIGCLVAGNPQKFISQILGWGVGVGGGIAFLLIVYAGFLITTAAGDPKRVQGGRELLVSAISGLILIVISVILLNFIGISILNLKGLGF